MRSQRIREAEARRLARLVEIEESRKAFESRRAGNWPPGAGSWPADVAPPDWSKVPRGGCSPSGPRCSNARDYKQKLRPCCVAINLELLRYVTELLTHEGITWWADYGTVLGAVRHGGMVPWDKDTDLGVLESDRGKIMDLGRRLKRAGLEFCGAASGTIKFRASSVNHTNCDCFAWAEDPRGIMRRNRYVASVDRFKGREFPASRLWPLTTVEFHGMTLFAPKSVRDPATPVPEGFDCFDKAIAATGSWFLEHRYGSPKDTDRPWWVGVRANNDGVVRK
jgi:hypothetical protein